MVKTESDSNVTNKEILRSLNQITRREEYDTLNQKWMFTKNRKKKIEFDDKSRSTKEKKKEKFAPAIQCYTWNWWTENTKIWRTETTRKITSVMYLFLDEMRQVMK